MSTFTAAVADDAARPTRTAGISLLAAGPACVVCGVPFLWPVLAAMGLGATPVIAHSLSWVLVPVLLVLLVHNTRRHGDRRPLKVAAAGAMVYALHVVVHFVPALGTLTFLATDQVAVALLGGAAVWDLVVTRRVRRHLSMVRQEQATAGAPAL